MKVFPVIWVYRDEKVCIFQIYFCNPFPVPGLKEGFQGVDALHFETRCTHEFDECFQVDDKSLPAILFGVQKEGGVKTLQEGSDSLLLSL